jgi:hypothetical protein
MRIHSKTGAALIEGKRRDSNDNGRRRREKGNDRCAQPDSPFPRFHDELDQAAAKRQPQNFVLYHYTTADGLKGIVEKDELWAASAYYLNDSTEIMYV